MKTCSIKNLEAEENRIIYLLNNYKFSDVERVRIEKILSDTRQNIVKLKEEKRREP